MSMMSASPLSSAPRLASTTSQNAAVFFGGAFGLKSARLTAASQAATWRLPPSAYQR